MTGKPHPPQSPVRNREQELDGRQIEEMRRRLNELTFLHETSQVLTATLDLDSVLRSLMTQVRAVSYTHL